MNRSDGIEFQISLGDQKKYYLKLSPENFKSQFQSFAILHQLSNQQAFQIKNYIQYALVLEVTRKSVDINYEPLKQFIPCESPKFTTLNEKMNQLNNLLHLEDIHLQQNIDDRKKESIDLKIQKKIEECQKQFRDNSQKQNLKQITEQKQIGKSQNSIFKRLNEKTTQSFKNKKNDDINRSNEKDLYEVQKYLLKDSLKRTSPSFFQKLHHHKTQSFFRKFESKQEDSEFINMSYQSQNKHKRTQTIKRNPYKIGSHQSKFKCQMKQCLKRQQNAQIQRRMKEDSIRQRMKDRSSKSPTQATSKKSISRSCQKCKEVSQKKEISFNKHKKINQTYKQREVKPKAYFSSLLAESYNEFMKQIPYHGANY